MLLRPAGSSVVAVVGAHGTLARNSIISTEALAQSSLSVAKSLVGAFSPRVQIVLVHHGADPSEVVRAQAERAVGSSPFRLAIETSEAFAVIV